MKKSILFSLFLVLTTSLIAQISQVNMQASGLTCSMCNLSIKKSLDKLSFIKNVNSDVETATFELEFKENSQVNFNDIKVAVINAGFSVAKLSFSLNENEMGSKNETEFSYQGKIFHIVDGKLDTSNSKIEFQIIDQGFISEKAIKKYKNKVKSGENVFNLLQTKA